MDGNNIIHKYPNQNYSTVFNKSTGFFARIEDIGYPEPFWAMSGPELIDILITNYCEKNCDFCYRNSNRSGQHIALEDYKNIIQQAKDIRVIQVALGGGNPNQHPQFVEI
jgi:MoaA/NifB/PqqE/SkfB family radical SAM enzyme